MQNEILVEGHNTTRHDGSAAIMLPGLDSNNLFVVETERISRQKHDGDSSVAYNHLKNVFSAEGYEFNTSLDFFNPKYEKHQSLNHHLGHASAAYYASGFDKAGILIVDGQGAHTVPGEYTSTSIWTGEGKSLTNIEMNPEKELSSQSIGLFYSAVSYHIGFGYLEEGKTMGLAGYGHNSELYNNLKKWINVKQDGSYEINPHFIEAMFYLGKGKEYFHWQDRKPSEGAQKIMPQLEQQFGRARDAKTEEISRRDMDLAWAVQEVLNETMLGLAQRTVNLSGSRKLCLAGGVALNSIANGLILKSGIADEIFYLPAASDEGQALGRLLYRKNNEVGAETFPGYALTNAYLGMIYSEAQTDEAVAAALGKIEYQKLEKDDLYRQTAKLIAEGNVIGWWQGRSEIGPRALGNRSILADPRNPKMKDHINTHVKHREWFRPLAPSVIEESAGDFFELSKPTPYMIVVSNVREAAQKIIPSVTHVDGTARPQTVSKAQNPVYHRLISELGKVTGVPVVMNTSFNDNGEPLVETPENAIRSFLRMKLDYLVVGDYMIKRK